CHPVREVECVEISPAGARAAEHFGGANGGILKDPRVRLVIGDGRNAVQFAKEPYDVIVSQPSNLWISGMSNLFTREFFAMAASRLTPDGVFCQWVQAYRMPLDDFRSILRTFFEVFPEGSFWEIFPGQDYILLGSTTPIRIPWVELEARLSAPGLKEHFDGLHVPGAAGLLGHFVAGAPEVRTAVATAPLLTDDQSTIEYTTSRAMFTFLQPRTIAWVQELRRSKLDAECYPGAQLGAVQRSRESQGRIAHVIGYEGERHSAREVLELLTKETGGLGEDEPTREHFQRIAYRARLDARFLRAAGRYDEAIKTLAAVPRLSKHYADALFERALIAQAAGKQAEAERCVRELLTDHPASFGAVCVQAQAAEGRKQYEEAVTGWRKATTLQSDSDFAFGHLASA